MKQCYLWGLFLVLCVSQLGAQDPSFSQFFNGKPFLNPAFIGLGDQKLSATAIHRSQWLKLADPYVTTAAFVDNNMPCRRIGMGLSVMQHEEGIGRLQMQAVHGQFRYDIPLGGASQKDRSVLSVGVQAGFVNRRVDWRQLVFSGQLDPITGLQNPQTGTVVGNPFSVESTQRMHFDASAGVSFINRRVVAGLAWHHFNGSWTNESLYPGEGYFEPIPAKMTLFIGFDPLSKPYYFAGSRYKTYLLPNYKLEVQRGLITQAIGCLATWNQEVYGGLYLQTSSFRNVGRSTHALVPYFCWRQNIQREVSYLDFALSGDIPLSGLGVDHAVATIEAMVRYNWLPRKDKCGIRNRGNFSKCPSFFGR